jgi:hypothetical protein
VFESKVPKVRGSAKLRKLAEVLHTSVDFMCSGDGTATDDNTVPVARAVRDKKLRQVIVLARRQIAVAAFFFPPSQVCKHCGRVAS